MMVKVLLYGYATGCFRRGRWRGSWRRRGVSGVGGGELSEPPHVVRVSPPALGGLQGAVRGGGASSARDGIGALREAVARWDEGSANASKRKAMSYARMAREGAGVGGGGRSTVGPGSRHRCAGGRALWGVVARRRVAGGVASSRGPVGGDSGGEGAFGGGATRSRRCARAFTGQDRNPKGGRPYKCAYGEPQDKAQSNFTDPDSAIMKTSAEGFQQCYNAQVAVDGEHQLIVATELTANASDQGAMMGLLDEVKETFDEQPEMVLADAGYCNERDLSELERGDRRVRGAGTRGQAGGGQGREDAPGDAPDGPEAGHGHGPGAVRATQVAVRSAQWLDQGGPGIPAIQRTRLGQSAGGMGLGVSGAEHQAIATASAV